MIALAQPATSWLPAKATKPPGNQGVKTDFDDKQVLREMFELLGK
jgi:hypothetical protein